MMFSQSTAVIISLALALCLLPELSKTRLKVPPPQGFVTPGWEGVQRAYIENFENGLDKGSAFAVYHKGKLVVDLWGGFANELTNASRQQDSVTKLFSTSKGIGAIVIAVLVDRGLLNYEEKVSKYWPEFAVNGKEDVTVEQLLSHQAGLYQFDEKYNEIETLTNWPKIKNIMEQQKPHWPPGENHGYHALTIGLFMDQLVRITDPKQRSLAKFFDEEIAIPFELDLSFGLKKKEQYRLCWMIAQNPTLSDFLDLNKLKFTLGLNSLLKSPSDAIQPQTLHNPEYLLIENPSHNAIGTARSTAKLYGILANGGKHNGKTLINDLNIIDGLKKVLVRGIDYALYVESCFGRGMSLLPSPTNGIMFGTPGYGGQMGYGDSDHNLGWAFTTNYLDTMSLGDDVRYTNLFNAMYDTVRKIKI